MYYTTHIIHRQAYYEPILYIKGENEQGDMHKIIKFNNEWVNIPKPAQGTWVNIIRSCCGRRE